MGWPLNYTLTKQSTNASPEQVRVFGYSVIRSVAVQTADAASTAIVTRLEVIAPPGTFRRSDRVTLPDGSIWSVEGDPEDDTHGPWWNPGLVKHYANQTTPADTP